MKKNQDQAKEKRKSRIKIAMPDAYVIIFVISLIAAVATYIIPSGAYETEQKGDLTTVVAGSYSPTEATPTTLIDFFTAIPQGLTETAEIVFLVLIIGGVISVFDSTGATFSGINALVEKTKGRKYLLIIAVLTIFGMINAVGVSGNAIIAFIPIGIMLARSLKLDAIAGVAMVYLGAYASGTVTPLDPAIMSVAQGAAELPLFSGAGYRFVIFFAMLIATAIYVSLYVRKISKDPSKSLLAGNPFPAEESSKMKIGPFTNKHKVIISVFFVGIGFFLYGVFNLDWSTSELTAIFIMMGIVVAVIQKMSPNEFVAEFMNGVRKLAYGAVIIGVARSIIVILENGQITDTIVHAIVEPMQGLPAILSALAMFVFNLFFNLVISSGSGQAAIVMPLMTPIADMLEFTRQSAVLAFKLGDGITNVITPASGVLMAVLAIGGVSWTKWVRFVFPLVLIWTGIGAVSIVIAVLMDYGPF